jgi:hypothetical protein
MRVVDCVGSEGIVRIGSARINCGGIACITRGGVDAVECVGRGRVDRVDRR